MGENSKSKYYLNRFMSGKRKDLLPNDAEKALTGNLFSIKDFLIIKYLNPEEGAFGHVFLVHLRRDPSTKLVLKLQCVNFNKYEGDLELIHREVVLASRVASKHV